MALRRILTIVVSTLFLATAAHAVQPDEVLDDPALEGRARAISAELRCMVCQNQSIDDSDAPLARDLRVLVRERLVAGDSDAEVMDYLVARYGEFVLLKPRFGLHTLILWAGAPMALIGGAIAAYIAWRRRQGEGSVAEKPAPLTADEKAELERLLKDG
ncbi:cytochrome c-type biogenesis protein [Stappia albiluteola]|nr:cytochrome c-type biogenesis protein [Stappia albiluteola]